MNASTDQQTNPEPRNSDIQNPVSKYSLSFGRDILTDEEREFLMERTKPLRSNKPSEEVVRPFRSLMNRRNLGLLAAILAVAVVHFSLQLNFSRKERSALRVPPIVEAPLIPDSVSPPTVIVAETEFQPENISVQPAPAPVAVPRRESTTKNARPQAPKPEATESRAARLRRAEKILTGI